MNEAILMATAFLTSTLSGVLGMGGGTLLLTVMAQFFPPAILIPVHGVIQMGSNGSRAILSLPYIRRDILVLFVLGAIVGALAGSQVIVTLPENLYRIILGCFILILTWMPKLESAPKIPAKFFFVGMVMSFLALFVGATGPLQAPFYLREGLRKEALIATKAACQTFQHFLKIVTFMALGFVMTPYLLLIGGMLLASFIGSLCGKLILKKASEGLFMWLFRSVITLLAIRMILVAIV
ncbi:MAG: hypothetical protein A2Z91_05620 [Deltaproteobacteria bacterium GWA2_38_16]|nr:MAG: hypothetical protein A2Z91_05620 [Deltaproteobacteria bacterium GWA2_38_16]OGQ03252.1 MAG: hypothetical protein A3D19_04345 [Deltaproteobacteria bacterium RIFCSPHIGHO2_02_FULL_38_15]OGQ34078.1 MAG: hypothetical protein A3A72_04525 [Deltaproteobacteria bacterium RIFCSPLOWO2_01_FULL_38_9]HBQ21851.1 sulfite exporter TauE/SafE family protein [Deltaproteobacteria bacterium]